MRGEDTIAAICRKYAIRANNYFKWSKEFIEAGKRRRSGDTLREATRDEVTELLRVKMWALLSPIRHSGSKGCIGQLI
ncbi:MAG: hypothetical protein IH593_05020 [Bacteroidales bacterium]|nr:hypothetical protein [Bacteroidales bacterium]